MIFQNVHILQSDGTILKNTNVIIQKDKICSISTKPVQEKDPIIYDGKGNWLLPGLINTHCHVPMTLCRGIGSDLPLSRWLQEAIFPIESKLTKEFIYWGSLLGICEMLRSGVTSFNDMYYFTPFIAKAVLESGIRANLSYDENAALRTTGEIKNAKYLYETYHMEDNGRLKIDLCIHSEYTTQQFGVEKVIEYAKETGLNIQLHLCETQSEVENCKIRHKKTPVAYFHDLGLFDCHTTAAHCVYLTEEDKQILSEKKVIVSHCPISNLKLGSGIADIISMQSYGITVSIGTDGAASNDNLNMLEDIKLVSLLQKGLHKDASLLPAKEILLMATKNGALSQSRPDIGVLSPGMKADCILVNASSMNLQPVSDLRAGFVYSAIPSNILMTMVDGKILYENGHFHTIDLELVLSHIREIGQKIKI